MYNSKCTEDAHHNTTTKQEDKKMTRADELNAEIRNQAVRLYPKCAGLFELPLMVYAQIVADNLTRSKPYRLSVEHCKKIILAMSEFD